MDPTKQRRQAPSKAALGFLVLATATYFIPTGTALTTMVILEFKTASVWLGVICGSMLYWALAYQATTAYRRLVVLRTIDLSLDPPNGRYFDVFAVSCIISQPIPPLLVFLPGPHLPWIVAMLSSLLIWGFTASREADYRKSEGTPYVEAGTRGNRLKTAGALRKVVEAQSSYREDQPHIWWGGVPLPLESLTMNFFAVGSVGSGKTLLLKGYMRCILPLVVRYTNWRAMIIDPKWELLPALQHIPRYKIKIINAGDARTHVWAANVDIRHERHIHEVAHILIPRLDESQPFFTDGARRLLEGAILSLKLQAPDDWWFSDIFYAVRSPKRLRTLLQLHEATRDILQAYGQNQRVFSDVFATLDSRLAPMYPVAAVWSHLQREEPARTVSLTEWVRGNFVLLIGKKASAGVSQGRLIEVLLKRTSQLLLDEPTGQSTLDPAESRRTIIIIDEAPRAGKLDILDLVTNGRDYGIGVCCATQSIDAMLEHYKKERLDALLNEFHSLALLSANSPTTTLWMADRLSKIDSIQPSRGPDGRTTGEVGWTYTLEPAQFQTLRQGRKIGPDCVPGVFCNSDLGAWYSDLGVDIPERIPAAAALEPIPDHWQTLRPWDDEDLERLNLTHLRDELDLGDDSGSSAPTPQSPTQRPPQPTQSRFPRFRT